MSESLGSGPFPIYSAILTLNTLNKYKLQIQIQITTIQQYVLYVCTKNTKHNIICTIQNRIHHRTNRQTVGATAQLSTLKGLLLVRWRVEVLSWGVVAVISWN